MSYLVNLHYNSLYQLDLCVINETLHVFLITSLVIQSQSYFNFSKKIGLRVGTVSKIVESDICTKKLLLLAVFKFAIKV